MDNNNFIRYSIFSDINQLEAFTTTKSSLPKVPRFTGDDSRIYFNNRKELAALLGTKVEQLIFPRQTHSNTVCEVPSVPDVEISATDALITSNAGLCLCVQTADCVPILLADPEKRVVAAVHAGWRGTVGKIVVKTVQKMQRDFGCDPAAIRAAIGPSIGPDVYEVGTEVVGAARKAIPGAENTLRLNASGKFHFDLWEANRRLLAQEGVLADRIQVLEACSFSEKDNYYSARRDGVNTGRMVSGIMLRE